MNTLKQSDTSECPEKTDILRYVAGECEPAAASLISAHLAKCASCQRAMQNDDSMMIEWLRVDDVRRNSVANACVKAAISELKRDPFAANHRRVLPEPPLPSGIRDYEIIAHLGAGGMGTVYKAMHRRLKRVAAVKVLGARSLRDPSSVQRFEREMEAVGKLEHPNIIRAYDAGDVDGMQYIAMEFIDGSDVGQLFVDGHPLTVPDACEVCRQAAMALSHAHRAGMIHRDVKPSNLMLTREGVVKLLDLGLARLEEGDGQQSDFTSEGRVMGTVDFMSPEQAEGLSDVDQRADVYSLGATLFYLLTGESLYGFDEDLPAWKRLHRITTQSSRRLSDVGVDVPSDLEETVALATNQSREHRIPSAEEFVERLAPYCESADLAALVATTSSDSLASRSHRADTLACSTPSESSRKIRKLSAPDFTFPPGSVGDRLTSGNRNPRWIVPAILATAAASLLLAIAIVYIIRNSDMTNRIEWLAIVANHLQVPAKEGSEQTNAASLNSKERVDLRDRGRDANLKSVGNVDPSGRKRGTKSMEDKEVTQVGLLKANTDKEPNVAATSRLLQATAAVATWSPAGDQVMCGKFPYNSGLLLINTSTGKSSTVLPHGKDPAWSPNGDLVAYVKDDKEVWLLDPKSMKTRKLGDGHFPTWSEDGDSVFYQSETGLRRRCIFCASVKTIASRPQAVVIDYRLSAWSTMSPSGEYWITKYGGSICVFDRNHTLLYRHSAFDWSGFLSSWSPDSKYVSFGTYGPDAKGLWVMEINTGRVACLVEGNYTMGRWSPDMKKICVDYRNYGPTHIRMLNWEPDSLEWVAPDPRGRLLTVAGEIRSRLSERRSRDLSPNKP